MSYTNMLCYAQLVFTRWAVFIPVSFSSPPAQCDSRPQPWPSSFADPSCARSTIYFVYENRRCRY